MGRVAKLADARDLKSRGERSPCGFDPRLGHCPRAGPSVNFVDPGWFALPHRKESRSLSD